MPEICPFCRKPDCWWDCPQADDDPDNPMNPPIVQRAANRSHTVHVGVAFDDLQVQAERVFRVGQDIAGADSLMCGTFVGRVVDQIAAGRTVESRLLPRLGGGGKIHARRHHPTGLVEFWFDLYPEDADADTDAVLARCDDALLALGRRLDS